MDNKNILISGAGIAGLTLAHFLMEKGFTPVVIEKSDSLRDGGYMIDFFSSGIYVSEQMNIISELAKKNHNSDIIKQVSEKYKKQLTLNLSGFRNSVKGQLFNFLRTDLVDVLYEKVKNKIDIRFSTSIQSITQSPECVQLVFDNGTTEHFDLVIGADGIHSNIRHLVYYKEEVEKYFLGYYVSGFSHNIPIEAKKGEVLMMNCPRRQVLSYSTGENANTSLFIFKSKQIQPRSLNDKIQIWKSTFNDFVKPVPEILEAAQNQKHLFFDEVSQIRIKGKWSKNRVVLLGDAAYCITLLSGQGASMAMTGAFFLASKLDKHRGDITIAFSEYENELRPKIETMQRKAVKNAKTYLPDTKFTLWLRNTLSPIIFLKIFSPLLIRQLGAENWFKEIKQQTETGGSASY